MAKGKLIALEAGDASGKATQTELLVQSLQRKGHEVQKVTFPDYESESSALVRMYLSGEFGTSPAAVSPYAAATFFAVDRYASFKTKWRDFYERGGIVVADRYTTSNMAHQAVKIEDDSQREEFLSWLEDLEYNRLNLPAPDLVIFLDMPPEVSFRLLSARRKNSEKKCSSADIHERNRDYLQKTYDAYKRLAARLHWQRIICSQEGEALSVEAIHEAVLSAVEAHIF